MSTKEEIVNALGAIADKLDEVTNEIMAIKENSDSAIQVLAGEGVSGAEFEQVSSHLEELTNEVMAVKAKTEEVQTEANGIGG
jgi:SMC interacting uncharacterized protein involved in chromosome segregation